MGVYFLFALIFITIFVFDYIFMFKRFNFMYSIGVFKLDLLTKRFISIVYDIGTATTGLRNIFVW